VSGLSRGRRIVASRLVLAVGLVSALVTGSASAETPSPAWTISSVATPTNFVPGDATKEYSYEVRLLNSGASSTNGAPITITDKLPKGLDVDRVELKLRFEESPFDFGPEVFGVCKTEKPGEVATVTCTIPSALPGSEDEPAVLLPGEELRMVIVVSTPPSAAGETLVNQVEVSGGGAVPATAVSENGATSVLPPSGLAYFYAGLLGGDGAPVTQAAAHPYQYTTSFSLNSRATPPGTDAAIAPSGGDAREIRIDLPPGLVGDPTATTRCTAQKFVTTHTLFLGKLNILQNECPDGSMVGFITGRRVEAVSGIDMAPIYNLVPPPGRPAQLGFHLASVPFYIDAELRTGGDYGISGVLRNQSQAKRLIGASVTLWGTPGDTSHDPYRGQCFNGAPEIRSISLGSCSAGIEPEPFLRMPTNCGAALDTTMRFSTWTKPSSFAAKTSSAAAPINCAALDFDPTIEVVPSTTVADSPSGVRVNLHLPQGSGKDQLATADLRDLTVTLPRGVSINPASATGLAGCGPAQIEMGGPNPAGCPGASKVGSVEVETPLLDHPIKGDVFVATQDDNPFRSLIAIYVAAHDPKTGIVLKLAGRVEPDPVSGQLKTTFTNNPQLPFEDLTTVFFDGPRAPLHTPTACGRYTTATSITPWSAPESGLPATPSDSFTVSGGPRGGACPNGALDPKLSAGVTIPVAGSYTPFVLRVSRDDGTGEFAAVDASTPPGLVARLKGVPYCSAAGLAQVLSRGNPGAGAAESSSPSCPAASLVGKVTAAAGPGPSPFYASGSVYLAGPYKGAPLSFLAVVPAVAGPFDLGVVVNRIAVQVDRQTAQVTGSSDPLPTILAGIPLDVRDIQLSLNKPNFTVAPTDCKPMSVDATVHGAGGARANASNRFQVGACKALDFAPRLSLALKGGTKRGDHPRLRAELRAKSGEANIARLSVALPHSAFLAQEHIRTICTRVRYAAETCPAGSIYGHIRAFTPLLDNPLEGPVYLRSSSNPLPDLVAALRGQVDIDLSGRIDSVNGGIRTTFDLVPDAAVSKVVLMMKGGKRGLVVNSRDLCRSTNRAAVKMRGQNGKLHDTHPVLRSQCPPKGRPGR
jgi:hypothetical protein